MTMSRRMGLIAVGILWTLGACREYKPVPLPEVRLNASPKFGYKVSLDVPEDIHLVENPIAHIAYTVINDKECVPIDYGRSLGGSRPLLGKTISSARFVRDPSGTYVGFVYADRLLNENYYGLAICRWQLNLVDVKFITTDSRNSAAIGINDQEPSRSQTRIVSCRRQTRPNDLVAEACFPGDTKHIGNFIATVHIERN